MWQWWNFGILEFWNFGISDLEYFALTSRRQSVIERDPSTIFLYSARGSQYHISIPSILAD